VSEIFFWGVNTPVGGVDNSLEKSKRIHYLFHAVETVSKPIFNV